MHFFFLIQYFLSHIKFNSWADSNHSVHSMIRVVLLFFFFVKLYLVQVGLKISKIIESIVTSLDDEFWKQYQKMHLQLNFIVYHCACAPHSNVAESIKISLTLQKLDCWISNKVFTKNYSHLSSLMQILPTSVQNFPSFIKNFVQDFPNLSRNPCTSGQRLRSAFARVLNNSRTSHCLKHINKVRT